MCTFFFVCSHAIMQRAGFVEILMLFGIFLNFSSSFPNIPATLQRAGFVRILTLFGISPNFSSSFPNIPAGSQNIAAGWICQDSNALRDLSELFVEFPYIPALQNAAAGRRTLQPSSICALIILDLPALAKQCIGSDNFTGKRKEPAEGLALPISGADENRKQ